MQKSIWLKNKSQSNRSDGEKTHDLLYRRVKTTHLIRASVQSPPAYPERDWQRPGVGRLPPLRPTKHSLWTRLNRRHKEKCVWERFLLLVFLLFLLTLRLPCKKVLRVCSFHDKCFFLCVNSTCSFMLVFSCHVHW